ncbi:MAG: enoyl-CoA hydratase-related protein [Chloroflexota bacterium]|nr:enoyl-CoA hydratase-related protein [Chloroflexota bacterium]
MLTVTYAKSVATVMLDRPEVRNALDAALIAAIRDCFTALATDDAVRVVVLTGAGTVFSAGADVRWMQEAAHFTAEENARDARALTTMLTAVDRCPKPVVARVNGAAFGGGAGLVACCDIAVAVEGALFSFSEVRLGIVPATIGPFVLRTIGASQSRALFLTAERFDAARAREIGLIHAVVPAEELDAAVARQTELLLHGGPHALAAAKELVQELPGMTDGEQRAYTAALIAHLRTSPEGQEGLRAFLDRRSPSWTPETD